MRLVVQLYNALIVPSPKIDFFDIARLSNLSAHLILLKNDSVETQNVFKRLIQSHDVLVSLIGQFIKVQEEGYESDAGCDELFADILIDRSVIQLLDLSKVS